MPVVLLAHGSRHPRGTASIDRLRDRVLNLAQDPNRDLSLSKDPNRVLSLSKDPNRVLSLSKDRESARHLNSSQDAARPEVAHTAYLDLNQPDLTATAARLAADGHREAIVVPLLFTPAFHARTDAPAAAADAERTTGVRLVIADILGTGNDLLPLLDRSLQQAGIGSGDLLLTSVGSSDAGANELVADLGSRVAARRGIEVRTAFATCAPRVAATLDEHPQTAGVLPLFVGHGLLLDKIIEAAAARQVPVAAPLETALAPIVLARYAAAGG